MQGLEEGYSFRTSIVLGFHGCDAKTADAIFSGQTKHLRPSENRYDWLGSGTYFWEASPTRALEFAKLSMHRPSPSQGTIHSPAIVGAIIDLGYCLDLLDAQYFDLVRNAYERLQKTVKLSGLQMPANRPLAKSRDKLLRNLDCSVINLIHESRRDENLRPFDSVRAAFIEGRPLYKGAAFHDRNHIQVCIRNLDCIKDYFRPIVSSTVSD